MGDGHLGKCKDCAKADVRAHYRATIAERHEYDRARNATPERRAARLRYQAKQRRLYPDHFSARRAVGRAVQDGRLQRLPCEVCGDHKSEAHHADYGKPLDVQWLCLRHHREVEGRVAA